MFKKAISVLSSIMFLMLFVGEVTASTITVFTAGVDDLYSTANGSEPATPSIGSAIAGSTPEKNFDQIISDRRVSHNFDLSSLIGSITGATLEIRMRPFGGSNSGSFNDSVLLKFYNDDGTLLDPDGDPLTDSSWSSRIGTGFTNELLPTQWLDSVQPSNGVIFNLDLSDLPRTTGNLNLIPDLNVARFIEVIVSDDTEVDYFKLSVTTVPVPAAVWLFGSGLIGLIGMARRNARV